MAKVVFVSAHSGTSKKGNAYNMLNFIQLLTPTEGDPYPREVSFFVNEMPEDVKNLHFGDVVEIETIQSENLSDPPKFSRVVSVISPSPYIRDGRVQF